ncbi:MAG: hypothetical protein JNL70_26570 [Saprospiraceae bacterium]|nr:hypothetical protein [Saprospiraceae bacterium]
MITAEQKDAILWYLKDNFPIGREEKYPKNGEGSEHYTALLHLAGGEIDTLNEIFAHFERQNLIYDGSCNIVRVSVYVQAELHKLIERGGYTVEKHQFTYNLEKLSRELTQLELQMDHDTVRKTAEMSEAIAAIRKAIPDILNHIKTA